MPPDNQLVNIPAADFERIASAPTALARLEAGDLLRRGDIAGASARLEAGIAESASIRASVQAGQAQPAVAQPAATAPAASPAPSPLAAPGTPSPLPFPMPPGLAAMRPPNSGRSGATAEDIASSHHDLSRPMGLRPIR